MAISGRGVEGVSNKKQRIANRLNAKSLARIDKKNWTVCMNCGELKYEGHFVPPSFADEGFFYCKPKQQEQPHD